MENFWVGVASREHVQAAVEGGFLQLSHGKEAPVRQLSRGDHLLFYSPRERIGHSAPVQAFTAAGRVLDDTPFQIHQGDQFHPFRRQMRYFTVQQASIHPLLQELSFTHGRSNWGIAFRRGTFRISHDDYTKIARAMRIPRQKSKGIK